ncbi:MAG: DUF433 domain-containing protein, partial [Acidobacteriaceae bacterium]|nr:DUF433 domain-containing protein [Acidobacteriaceae bacterium]
MLDPVIVRDPEIIGGEPCFRGTRVPAETNGTNEGDLGMNFLSVQTVSPTPEPTCYGLFGPGALLLVHSHANVTRKRGQANRSRQSTLRPLLRLIRHSQKTAPSTALSTRASSRCRGQQHFYSPGRLQSVRMLAFRTLRRDIL